MLVSIADRGKARAANHFRGHFPERGQAGARWRMVTESQTWG